MYREPIQYAATKSGIPCPVCGGPVAVRPAKGRKSNKPFLMLLCPEDARHFRAFISDQTYIRQVLDRLEANKP